MLRLYTAVRRLREDLRAQDLIEYALVAASVSMTAGAFLPQWVGPQIVTIFSKVNSVMTAAS